MAGDLVHILKSWKSRVCWDSRRVSCYLEIHFDVSLRLSPYCNAIGKESLWERKILQLVLNHQSKSGFVLFAFIEYCISFDSPRILQGFVAYILGNITCLVLWKTATTIHAVTYGSCIIRSHLLLMYSSIKKK